MTASKIVEGAAGPPKPAPAARRVASFGLGLVCAALGGGGAVLMGWGVPAALGVLLALAFGVMAAFGVSLVVQAWRGAPFREGFLVQTARRVPAVALWGGVPLALALAAWIDARSSDPFSMAMSLSWEAAWWAFALHLAVHEAGHFLAARAAGIAVSSVRIGPFELRRDPEGWRPRLCNELRFVLNGCVKIGAATPWRAIAAAAAGPAATLGLTVVTLGLNPYSASSFFQGFDQTPVPRHAFVGAMLALGLALLLLSCIPIRHRNGWRTDGLVILVNLARIMEAKLRAWRLHPTARSRPQARGAARPARRARARGRRL
jgi:hypothetical protein